MLKFAVMNRNPAENAQSIVTKGVSMLGIGQPHNETLVRRPVCINVKREVANRYQSTFGINVAPQLITVQGRVLTAPQIMYGGEKMIQAMYGGWNMKSIKFSRPATLNKWTWLCLDSPSQRYPIRYDELDAGLRNLTKSLRDMGINANPPSREDESC